MQITNMSIIEPRHLDVLIVDDEQDACKSMAGILSLLPDTHIAGFAHNTIEAEALLQQTIPDAVFLDIEMPGENAFQFLERISPFYFEVVFVTAYNDFAVRAFKLNAVDYILKPADPGEVQDAVRKLEERIWMRQFIQNNKDQYKDLGEQIAHHTEPDKIILRENHEVEVVAFNDICFVEAHGSYSRIFFMKNNSLKSMMMSNNIAEYELLLPPALFFRIHKSYLLNPKFIRKIIKDETASVVLNTGEALPVSRRRYATMLTFLKNNKSLK